MSSAYSLTACRRCGAAVFYPDEMTSRGCVSCAAARLHVRSTVYGGQAGCLVYGRDQTGRSVSVFCLSRAGAEGVRRKILRGESVEMADLVAL